LRPNPLIAAVAAPPIAAARGWVAGRAFPADRPLIDLTQAVPGHPPPADLAAHLAARAGDPDVHRYTDILGLPALRAAHAARLSTAYGAEVSAAAVGIVAGCNQAFCLAMMALARAGDEVILPTPWYFNHRMWLDMLGVTAVPLPFRPEAAGVPAVADAARLIGPRTRAIVLVTPNNPTGAVYPPGVLRAFRALARERGIAMVIDETYKDFLAPGAGPHGLFAESDWADGLVQLYSFSKVYALTGHRVGSVVAGPALLAEIEKIMDCVGICAPHLGQIAALYGIRELDPWVAANGTDMRARADAFAAGLVRIGGWRLVSIGAYFAYVAHPWAELTAEAAARRLVDGWAVLSLPGSMFGPDQERFLRLAFANVSDEIVPEVIRRLADAAA
jgi:aspartate/methionine/tyrosine aminotransferase